MALRDQGRVCLGVIVGTRGVKGELRIKSFTDDPRDIDAYGPLADETGTRNFDLKVTGATGGVVLARLDGVEDRTAAEALKGTELYVASDMLPEPDEDEFYLSDLKGLEASTPEGEFLGTVTGAFDFGAGTIIEITGPVGRGVMVPFTRVVVPEIDMAGGKVTIQVPPGLLEPAEPEQGQDRENED